jgi:phage head maturation protease
LNADYVDSIRPAIAAGLYACSIGFTLRREVYNPRPGRSASNPEGLPERRVTAALLREISITPNPAYDSASAELLA